MTLGKDASLLLDQWNRTHSSVLHVRPADLAWNLNEQKLLDYRIVTLDQTMALCATAASAGAAAGLATSTIWLSLWGEIPKGREKTFVSAYRDHAGAIGKTRLVFGADEFHFLPGIPVNDDAGLRLAEAVKTSGFDGAEAADYLGDLSQPEVSKAIDEAQALATRQGWRFAAAETPADFAALEAFLSKEFPGRWSREFLTWRDREDTGRAFWKILRQNGDEILGFARMAVRDRVKPLDGGWTPGALRLPLGFDQQNAWSDRDGCLGPIGVAASQRGKGAGRVLLGLVLQALRQHRAERICIDWTNAFKYYEPLHFELARQYWTAWMSGTTEKR